MKRVSVQNSLKCPWYMEDIEQAEHHCVTCLRRNLSLFSELNKDELVKLNANKRMLYFSKDEPIFKQSLRPAGLYALSSGMVKNVRTNEAGVTHLVDLNKPVDFLGFGDFISDCAHSYSAIALENCTICFIPGEDFMNVMADNGALIMKSLQFVSKQHRRYIERISNLSGKNMRGRMADILMYIYDVFDLNKSRDRIKIELKRSDYGSLAQMNTANAIRTLSEFSKTNLIEFKGQSLFYMNVPALRQISLNQ
ncbi:MAG: Crp/Fnr family transcriptional regulator [Saprospiraceae bacterium]|nr:Crp/Fnr family transcriptional regulator [Saprospiraceae bacterium]